MRKIIFTVFVVFCALPLLGVKSYNYRDRQENGDWFSAAMVLDHVKFIRAGTYALNSHEFFLAIDFQPGECIYYNSKLIIVHDESATKNAEINLEGLQARIDEKPIHNGSAVIDATRGSAIFFLYVHWEEGGRWLEEVRNGNVLRIRLPRINGEEAFLRFSLSGSNASLNRAALICDQTRVRKDEDYFD